MFLEHNEKIVNTDSVTNIVIEGNKIIFNLDYGVSLQDDINKIIPDYVYMVIKDQDAFQEMKTAINDLNWITSDFGNYDRNNNYRTNNRIVNPAQISFLKFDERKQRIIFNLRNSVSFNRNPFQRTSDFVYFDHTSVEDFDNESIRIRAIVGVA